jgi:hypothetical protein
MKNKMNVLKKEAKQICFNEGNKFIPNHYGLKDNKDNILCIYNSRLIFDFGFLTCLDYDSIYENYKDYEWRLIENKRLLNRGDVVKVEEYPNKWSVAVFDNLFDDRFNFWRIRKNRPNDFYVFKEQIYKLFKKSDKK